MNFQLKCRHMECPDDLKQAVSEKITRFEPLIPENAYLELELMQHAKVHVQGDKHAEVTLDIPGIPVIRFVREGSTFLEAVDRALDKLDTELTEKKDRLTDHSYNGDPLKVRAAEDANRDEL